MELELPEAPFSSGSRDGGRGSGRRPGSRPGSSWPRPRSPGLLFSSFSTASLVSPGTARKSRSPGIAHRIRSSWPWRSPSPAS
ncbi:MAG: hypothetical protein MZU79_05400 [Anaerotruncus sp.]|nr:hypothetical protein [Anaerotruncus sp.]